MSAVERPEDHIGWQTIDVSISFVGRDKPLLIVDHAEPKRHIVHCCVEPFVLLAHQRAEAALTLAGGTGRVRFRLVSAPLLGAETDFERTTNPMPIANAQMVTARTRVWT
jgi:hypothetical protein